MKRLTFLIFIVPMLALGQEKRGYIDENGWKQGVFKEYYSNGNVEFIRTYRNDTLNGFLGCYHKDGSKKSEEYRRNGEIDSICIEYYYGSNIVEKKSFYKSAKKNGEFIYYYESGKISYNATFQNDTLVGNETYFFENGKIQASGNRRNGTWKAYCSNGQLTLEQKFRNSRLVGETKLYADDGKLLIPTFIKEKEIKSDTSIINETDLKVFILFDQYNKKDRLLKFRESLFYGAKVCKKENLIIQIGREIFIVKRNGVEIHETLEVNCENEIETKKYGINREVKELPSGKRDVKYVNEKIIHKIGLGNLEVERKRLKCDDTGTNPITIYRNGKKLEFKEIDNLQFFEFDTDSNGKNELYVLTYRSCSGLLRIYKIDE
ncbi:MAG: hypothetical protein ABII90_06895 [Bacteroidota bacterium]